MLDKDCIGLANLYFVDKKEALKMIKHFNDEFHKKPKLPASMKKHKDSIWIDASVINAFSDFLETNSANYDGVRIVNVAYNNDSSNIFLVPTSANGSDHNEKWTTQVTAASSTFRNFNIDTNIVNPLIRKFGTLYRAQSDASDVNSTTFDSLSAKIWLSSCVFNLLSDTIKHSGGKLDGVMVYFAAYDKKDATRLGFQKRDNQSTVILVATNPNGSGGHKPDWDAIKSKLISLKMFPAPDPGGYNHGELCPTKCN